MAISVSKRRSRAARKTQQEEKTDKLQDQNWSCLSGGAIFCRLLFRFPVAVFLLFLVYLWSSSTTVISGNIVHICVSSRKLSSLYCLSAGTQPGINIPVNNSSIPVNTSSIPVNNTSIRVNNTSIPELGTNINITETSTALLPQKPDQNSEVILDLKIPSEVKEEINSNETRVSSTDGSTDAKEKSVNEVILVQERYESDLEDLERFNYISFKNGEEEEAVKEVHELLQVQRSWSGPENNKNRDSNTAMCQGKGVFVYDLPSKFNKDLLGQCDDMVPWANFCNFFKNDALGEPIDKLGKDIWYHTHQYSLEPIFHNRVLKHPCRVYDETQAKLFYVPFYGGLDILRWHFKNVSEDVKDSLGLEIIKWLEPKKSWKRNSGMDHVFVLGKISWDFRRNDRFRWGSRLLELQEMQKPVKLLIERHPWKVNDVAVPHPTYFHPRSDEDIESWQVKIINAKRGSLVSFAGAARPGQPESIRANLIQQCKSFPDKCRLLNCTDGGCDKPEPVMDLFLDSEFCLQPPGDSPTRKSVFDSLISGCIPVLFDPYSAYYQYAWYLPEDHNRYSVYVNQEDVRKKGVNVVEKLMGVPLREREDMRSYIVHELLPGLVYGHSDARFERFRDAFDITVDNLLGRINKL